MIKIKLGELPKVVESLVSLHKRDFKAKTSYRIARLSKKIFNEFEILNVERMKLIEKYGLKDENGKLITTDGHYQFEDLKAFEKEIKELFESEIQLDIEPLSIDDFGDTEVSPSELMGLEKLLKEEER